MIHATPESWASSRYTLTRDGAAVGTLVLRLLSEAGEIAVADERFTVRRERPASGRWLLQRPDGLAVATAEKPSAWRNRLVIRADGRPAALHVDRVAMWAPAYDVRENDRRIGAARRVSMFTRRMSADLPDDLPLHVQAFVLWLLVMLFRRESKAG